MLRKLLTRPIWWRERKRPYLIRSRFHLLLPLGIVKGRARFVALTTTSALNDAMWAAWSWYRYLRSHGFELQLAVDGEIPAGVEPAVQKLFPGISLYNVWSVLSRLCDEQPALGVFLRGHPVAKQVGPLVPRPSPGVACAVEADVCHLHRRYLSFAPGSACDTRSSSVRAHVCCYDAHRWYWRLERLYCLGSRK